jgi:exopolysaccharide biosynthesis protein
VGFDRDSTKLYLCVVDGRQEKSIGMSFGEMADFLLSMGVWNAVNFDGGGSTTMVIRGKIVNSPSDKTGERPVANSFQVVNLGPPGSVR